MTTGKDLKLRRVAADVKANRLAAAMGVSPGRVGHIEASRIVTEEAAERYLAALRTCSTNSTDEAVA